MNRMTRRMKALAMYPLCWVAFMIWRFLVAPFAHPGPLYRVSLWLLPWVGMYAYSDGFEDFCQCTPFQRKAS